MPQNTISRVTAKGVLPDVDSRTLAATSEEGAEGSRVDQGCGVSKNCEEGPAVLRLCNLVAQSSRDDHGAVQAGSRERVNWAGNRTVGDCLFQVVQESDAGGRAGNRDRSLDAGDGQIPRLLPGDDLCRLPGRSESGK